MFGVSNLIFLGLMREAAERGDTDEVDKIAKAIIKEMRYYNRIGIPVGEMGSRNIERWSIHREE